MLKWFRKKRVLAGITAMTLVIGNANSVTLFAEGMPVDAVSPKEEVENIESVEITPDNASPTTDEDDGIEQVEFQGECTEKNEEGNSQEAGTMPESDPGNSMDAGLIEDELSENIMPPLEGDFASEGGDLLSDPEEADTNSEPADATSENEPEQIYTEGMDESGEETEATQSSEVIADTLDEGSQYGGFTYSISDGTATITGYTGPGGDIEIPGEIEGYAVTEIGNSAFSGQSEITGTILPESITSIGINAFRGTGIESITIPKNVTSCGWWNKTSETDYYNGPFAGATRLKEVTFAEGTKKVPAYILASYNLSSSVEKVILPEGVEEIGDYAFYYCRELSEITLPKTLKTIGDEAFDFCGTLVEIDLPNGLTKIGYKAFTSTGIKHVKIPNTLAICRRSRYYGPFGSTNSLEEVEFEPGIKKIPGNVLRNCFSVTKVSLPTGVEEIGDYAFSDCTNLQDINIPGSVKSIGDEAFSYCRNLEYISLPRNLKSIGYEAFMKTGIGKITIPKGLEKCGNYSNNGPFAGTTKLSKVVFEKGLKKIPDSTLSALSASPNPPTSKDLEKYGSYVTAVVIPDTVKSVGDSAFMNCNMLADIYYAGSEEKWKAVTVGQNNDPLLKAAVHYDWEEEPDGKTEKVKSDAYGVTEYESDAMGRIYDSIKEYSLAEYSFYDTIGARFKEDYKNAGKEANNFRQLRQYDEELGRKNKTNRMLTIEADDDAAIDDAYEVLYGFLKECLSTAEQENIIDLSDISSSDSTTLVESKMINKIYDSLKDGSRLYSGTGSNGYHVELMTGGIFHFFTGSASINGTKKGHMGSYTGAFCSSGALVSAAMNQFIEDLSEEVRKQAKDAAKSLWDYVRKESGIAAISKAYAEDIFKTHAGYLLQKGYGNLYMTIKKLFSGYEILRDVSRAKTATAAVKILNSSDLKAFYEQVKKTEYTDDEITNEVVKDGLDAVEKARKKLETALFDYLYNEDTYDSLSLGEKIEYKWKAFSSAL
ncbi:MAG: leucine-rich repeat protein [Bacteroidales bacterium]|nr:leucine-rich repeat protein [Bacteroidales bacterium]